MSDVIQESSKKETRVKSCCSLCKLPGHNKRTCPSTPSKPEEQPKTIEERQVEQPKTETETETETEKEEKKYLGDKDATEMSTYKKRCGRCGQEGHYQSSCQKNEDELPVHRRLPAVIPNVSEFGNCYGYYQELIKKGVEFSADLSKFKNPLTSKWVKVIGRGGRDLEIFKKILGLSPLEEEETFSRGQYHLRSVPTVAQNAHIRDGYIKEEKKEFEDMEKNSEKKEKKEKKEETKKQKPKKEEP